MPLKYISLIILLFISIVVNFNMPKRIIDKIQMITAVGYDYVDDNTIKGTVVTPTFLQVGEVTDSIYTGSASMITDLGSKLNLLASERLVNGKLEVVLFNEKLAKHGIKDYIDFLLRDPDIGSGLFLAIVEGSTGELLRTIQSKKGIGVYLSDLIEHNIERQSHPQTNLKLFNYSLECRTCDPYLPYLKIVDGIPKINGIALFKKDKYFDRIPMEESFVFNILNTNLEDSNYVLERENYRVAIQNIESNKDMLVNQQDGNLNVQVNIKIEGVVREYTGEGVLGDKKKIRNNLEKELSMKTEKMIKNFQEKNIDPLGIKEQIRSKIRGLSIKQINEKYQSIFLSTNVTYTNMESGTRR